MSASLWLFYRSHSDLGTNWSVSLEIRKNHSLITKGIYTRIRHPMYLSLFLYALGQTCLLANWIAGPSCLFAFTAMYCFRINREEKMLLEIFGEDYKSYSLKTKRLVPYIY